MNVAYIPIPQPTFKWGSKRRSCHTFMYYYLSLKSVEITGARLMPHVRQGLLNLPEHFRSHAVISVVRVARSLVFCVVFLLSVIWPLCCLLFFNLRSLITPLVSSNSSCRNYLQFRSTWFKFPVLVWFVLLDLLFSTWWFVVHCLSFCPFSFRARMAQWVR